MPAIPFSDEIVRSSMGPSDQLDVDLAKMETAIQNKISMLDTA
jgi:hypothetical protein